MARIIQFEERAVARLRERLGEAEVANEQLIAFAHGHSGAVASIHAAALAAIESTSVDELFDVITHGWPNILGIDSAAIAFVVGDQGLRADSSGIRRVEAAVLERMLASAPPVEARRVTTGHPLFGLGESHRIRAEALIRIDSRPPVRCGLLALGQHTQLELESGHGSELLLFLGGVVGATVRRVVATS